VVADDGNTSLDQLKKITTVVADSGDFSLFEVLKPQDATTNPSLIFKAASMDEYAHLVQEAHDLARGRYYNQEEIIKQNAKEKAEKREGQTKPKRKERTENDEIVGLTLDQLAVIFGREILTKIKGRVSTEIDARLSYNTKRTVEKCRVLAGMYEEMGIYPDRVLFKIAATWEGIKAAEVLQKEGFNTNLTLLFSFAQAVACAQAGVFLISPFVGRILDFWKKETGKTSYPTDEDPGVVSVTKIYNYYKSIGCSTIVMGASFRSLEEILALAGCDYLTISPNYLQTLSNSTEPVVRKLDPEAAKEMSFPEIEKYNEKTFRWELGQDACGTAKLAEGIKLFAEDTEKLEKLIREKFDLQNPEEVEGN